MADAGRVIAGSAKGVASRRARARARGRSSDRVKQTLFAVLEPELEDAVVLDLFAGSGAGGIEALVARRGAGHLRGEGRRRRARPRREPAPDAASRRVGRVVRRDAIAWLADPAGAAADGPFDLVLVDPPYADTAALVRALELVGPARAPGWPASSPSTSGATRRRPRSGC